MQCNIRSPALPVFQETKRNARYVPRRCRHPDIQSKELYIIRLLTSSSTIKSSNDLSVYSPYHQQHLALSISSLDAESLLCFIVFIVDKHEDLYVSGRHAGCKPQPHYSRLPSTDVQPRFLELNQVRTVGLNLKREVN